MPYETILCERRGAVASLTLNRETRLNAMNATMLHEFHRAMDEIEADDGVRAVVLSGAGTSFCSGFDLQEQAAQPPSGTAQWRGVLRRDFDAIMRFWRSRAISRSPPRMPSSVSRSCVSAPASSSCCCRGSSGRSAQSR